MKLDDDHADCSGIISSFFSFFFQVLRVLVSILSSRLGEGMSSFFIGEDEETSEFSLENFSRHTCSLFMHFHTLVFFISCRLFFLLNVIYPLWLYVMVEVFIVLWFLYDMQLFSNSGYQHWPLSYTGPMGNLQDVFIFFLLGQAIVKRK